MKTFENYEKFKEAFEQRQMEVNRARFVSSPLFKECQQQLSLAYLEIYDAIRRMLRAQKQADLAGLVITDIAVIEKKLQRVFDEYNSAVNGDNRMYCKELLRDVDELHELFSRVITEWSANKEKEVK